MKKLTRGKTGAGGLAGGHQRSSQAVITGSVQHNLSISDCTTRTTMLQKNAILIMQVIRGIMQKTGTSCRRRWAREVENSASGMKGCCQRCRVMHLGACARAVGRDWTDTGVLITRQLRHQNGTWVEKGQVWSSNIWQC